MGRTLRWFLLGSIALAYVVLFAHAREPIRLDVGDPSAEASALMPDVTAEGDNPPLSRLVFTGARELLGSDIGVLRPLALIFAALASWLLFSYVSRLYDRRVGLVATMLFSTSLLWLAHADSIHHAPLLQCTGFLTLWGTVRAIETKQLRHEIAVGFGTFACLATAYDYYLLLPVAVVATLHIKTGRPFARSHLRVLTICAAGAIAAIVMTCALGHVPRIAETYDRELVSTLPAVARRVTLGFTPLVWITVGFHTIRAIRARTVADAINDSTAWLLVVAVIWLLWFSPEGTSRMIGLQVLLPFYAIGSSVLVMRMLDRGSRLRALGMTCLVVAPLWSFFWMLTQPRAYLDRDNVAKMKKYLAANDTNDVVLSNLLDDAPLEAALGRHTTDAIDAKDVRAAPRMMLRLFEVLGTDSVHAIIFTDPESRLSETPLSVLAMHRHIWSVLGWPQVARHKSSALIHEYDQRVLANLVAMRATKVLQMRNVAMYRIERAATQAALADQVPTTTRIDLDTVDASLHELLGWGELRESYQLPHGTTLEGFWRCRETHCNTTKTDEGLVVRAAKPVQVGQLMIRLEQPCDLAVSVTFNTSTDAQLGVGGFSSGTLHGNPVNVTIPASALAVGVNVLEIENLLPTGPATRVRVSSIDLVPLCASR